MAIRPIDLPAAAGIDYSGGDVRHFSQGDAVNVPGLSNPTRNLAERDNRLAEKVNELVSVVNNQEQFVPLPVIRTNVPPAEEIVVTNYRIPAGFEARVLNGVVSTTPASTSAELNVYYSASYGGNTGTAVVTVTPGSEFTGDVNFYQTGEFILTLKNTGTSTLEIAASIMLTMRPLGAEGTLLVGSVIEGEQGPPGMKGGPGPPGPPGTGGAGSPGMVWRGPWVNGNAYLPNDVVSHSFNGTYGSWINRVPTSSISPETDSTVTWNYVAFGIAQQGTQGPPGSSLALVTTAAVDGTLQTGADWTGYSIDGYDASGYTASGQFYKGLVEVAVKTEGGTAAMLFGAWRMAFLGSGTIVLPKTAYGALTDYTNSSVFATISLNGSGAVEIIGAGTLVRVASCVPSGADAWTIQTQHNAQYAVTIYGVQYIP